MKVLLTDDEGVVLDSIDVSRKEWVEAQERPMAAFGIIASLQAGDQNG
jgi:hypothetical protein